MSDYFIFDDIDTRDYEGILVYFNEVDTTPKRVGEFIQIPNRNGSFFLDGGRYEDATHTYDIVALSKEYASDLINALASKVGYFRLQDSFNTDEFYSAVFNSEIEPKITKERDKLTFKVTFTRKPQRWLTSGESAVTVGEWSDWETESGPIVEIEASETDKVKSLSVALEPIQDLNGYDHPWVGGAGKNKFPPIEGRTVSGITAVVNDDGSVTLNGTATSYAQFRPTAQFQLKAGTYILSGNSDYPNTAIFLNGISGSTDVGSGARVTLSEDTLIDAVVQVYSDKTVSNVRLYPMIRLATESDTYEPYTNICPISGRTEVKTIVSPTTSATDGQTYTTALGRTVYGGTLDVVSGVLTVTHGVAVFDGSDDENWTRFSAGSASAYAMRIASTDFNIKVSASTEVTATANYLVGIGASATWGNYNGFVATTTTYPNNIFTGIKSITTVADWKAYLAENPLQVCYELATPQTYQLTPTEVALLKGNNNVWSDGDVTLEYGQDPNVIVNPTLFESSPLLEFKGYGTIEFNGYEIEIDNTDLGEVVVYPRSLPNANITITIDTQYLNQGDSIYFGKGNNDLYFSYLFGSGKYKTYAGTVSSQVNVKDASITNYSSYGLTFKMSPDTGTGFVYGTPRTINSSLVFYYTNNNIQYPQTVNTSISYDGNDSITFSYARTGTESSDIHIDTNPYVCINKIYAFSTSPIDIGTIYVDCDLGECYLEESGTIISINQQVDLGSRLPTLASGTNEIIFDNTITELNIVPRWWKV